MKIITRSKAETLLYLEPKVRLFKVPKLLSFSVLFLKKDFPIIFGKIQNTFKGCKVALRSSAADEDGHTNSSAGEYASVLNISSDKPKKIKEAINTVIASYEEKRPLLPDDEERDDDPLERLTDPELLEPDELLLTELPELLVEEPEEALQFELDPELRYDEAELLLYDEDLVGLLVELRYPVLEELP